MNRPAIRTPAELYAHAIAIEREAADTYAEFDGDGVGIEFGRSADRRPVHAERVHPAAARALTQVNPGSRPHSNPC